MKKTLTSLSLFSLAISLSACSSIIEGTSQEIVINTNPPAANCVLTRNGTQIGNVGPTPSGITIKKTKYDILISCSKPGFETATYLNKSGAAGATFGNIVLGGGVGWAIDSASGADNKYDSPVNLSMVPQQQVQPPSTPASGPNKPVSAP